MGRGVAKNSLQKKKKKKNYFVLQEFSPKKGKEEKLFRFSGYAV